MENQLSLPKGLLVRGTSYFFQARIPKRFQQHYPKPVIRLNLPTDSLKEAVRLVHRHWSELHEEFALIDSTGSRTTGYITQSTITLDAMKAIVDRMVHSGVAGDGSMRSMGYHTDPNYKARALSKLGDDEQTVKLAISQGNYEGLEESAVSWLKGSGYVLATNSAEFRAFAELFAEGMSKVNASIRERDKGNIVDDPKPPTPIDQTNSLEQEDSLDSLRLYWLSQSKKSRTSEAEAITIINKFKKMVGDIKPADVTKRHVAELKDKMLEAGSAPATINKGRGILAAIFSTAEKNGKLDKNPFSGIEKLKVPEKEEENPYTLQELQTIFNSPIYTEGFRTKRFQGDASYWMPLLSLYSAGRLNEIGQLYAEDVGEEDGIPFIIIKHEESSGRFTKDKKRRRVPLHPDLIKMGFLKYVKQVKDKGHQQLFPELSVTRSDGKRADKWGDWWREYVRDELKITRIPQPYHAFRHTFTEYGRRCSLNYESRMRIEGHSMNTVGDKSYGNSLFPLEPLYDELKKLTFKGLDLSHLFNV